MRSWAWHRPAATWSGACCCARRLTAGWVASPYLRPPPAGRPRAAASKAAPAAETVTPRFEVVPCEPPCFSELAEPGREVTLVGIDPDISGALAVLRWRNNSGSSSSSGGGAGATIPGPASIQVTVHDIPVDVWQLGSREKRHPDAAQLAALLQQFRAEGSAGAEGGEQSLLQAVYEYTTPQHLSGKFSWYGIGFSTGLITGLLAAQAIPYQRVNAAVWKRQLGLFKQGKEGSLALAKQLFPQAEPLLRRKKDHGRAEAILIAAWALGLRARALAPPSATAPDGAANAADSGGEL